MSVSQSLRPNAQGNGLLYQAGGKLLVSQLSYHAVTAIKTSDHRAVAAAFEVRGRGSREQDGAAAGRGGQAATGGCGGGGACAVQ